MSNRRTIETVVVALCVTWCAGIVAAPLLHHMGATQTSAVVYEFYGRICHQIDSHSWHIGGAKLGVCVRCTSIYVSFTIGAVIWVLLSRPRPLTLPRPRLLFVAGGLMLLDVVLNTLGLHASSSLTRAITGGAFGAVLPWIVLPVLLDAIDQLRRGQLPTAHSPAGDRVHV